MTSLEIFAFFVMPGLTAAMAAIGYLVVRRSVRRSTKYTSQIAAFSLPSDDEDFTKDLIPPEMMKKIDSIYPADMAGDYARSMNRYLAKFIDSPDELERALARFKWELRAARIAAIRSRLMKGTMSSLERVVGFH